MSTHLRTAILILLAGCGEQNVKSVSGLIMEAKLESPDSVFSRGGAAVGESCTYNRDCKSLSCIGGVCTHACRAAACPSGAACTFLELAFSCNTTADCAAHSGCQGRLCDCFDNVCVVDSYCYAYCGTGDTCGSDRTHCENSDALSVSICVPDDFREEAPVPQPRGVGESCPTGLECAADLACVDGPQLPSGGAAYPQGYCTRECGTSCPAGSTCVILDEGVEFCHADCAGPGAPCDAPGAACVDLGGAFVCIY